MLGDGFRHLAAEFFHGQVNCILTDDAVGGVLTTGNGNHTRSYASHGVVAGQVGGGIGLTG